MPLESFNKSRLDTPTGFSMKTPMTLGAASTSNPTIKCSFSLTCTFYVSTPAASELGHCALLWFSFAFAFLCFALLCFALLCSFAQLCCALVCCVLILLWSCPRSRSSSRSCSLCSRRPHCSRRSPSLISLETFSMLEARSLAFIAHTRTFCVLFSVTSLVYVWLRLMSYFRPMDLFTRSYNIIMIILLFPLLVAR